MFLNIFFTFLAGAIYEAGCVMWVYFSEINKPWHTALMSMLVATAQVIGIGESIHDMRMAPAFILGYGVGTFIAVKYKTLVIKK